MNVQWSTFQSLETGKIPVFSLYPTPNAMGLEILCLRTRRRFLEWQIKTHGAILRQYVKLKREYDNYVQALAVSQGVTISGRNPAANRALERTELQRSALTILTGTPLYGFGAIVEGANGLPELDVPAALEQGPLIRFLQQAFEWEQITYVLYPYFWARSATWAERAFRDEVDTIHAAFLRAGAARVVVPVRLGHEAAVQYFLMTGKLPSSEPPSITDPLFVPIVQELQEQQGRPGTEVAQGPPWEVRLPTTLVRLKGATAELPEWDQDANGIWSEIET